MSVEMTLPTFIVIGTAKAGTTSIHAYMRQHPEICMSEIKETNFFAYEDIYVRENWPNFVFPVTTIEDYEKQFSHCRDCSIIGESSPIYIHSQKAACKISHMIRRVKLIVCLRHPVDRAISGYLMHARHGIGTGDFNDFDFNMRYVKHGFYANLLEAYLCRFGPEAIKICLFDDLVSDPTAFMRGLYAFVGASPDFVPNTLTTHNVGSVPRSTAINKWLRNYTLRNRITPILPRPLRSVGRTLLQLNQTKPPTVPERLLKKLQGHFNEEIRTLHNLTGFDLSHWINKY